MMMQGLCRVSFLSELWKTLGVCQSERAVEKVESGKQAVVAIESDRVTKVYGSCLGNICRQAWEREVGALTAFGAFQGQFISIPSFKSSGYFDKPFTVGGMSFFASIEQERVFGSSFSYSFKEVLPKVGSAIGELHTRMNSVGPLNFSILDLIDTRLSIVMDKHSPNGHVLKPSDRKKLTKMVKPIADDRAAQRLVHGDMHPGNILVSRSDSRMAFLDFGNVGRSVPEQDVVFLAVCEQPVIRDVFKCYAKATGGRLDKSRMMALFGLDLAVSAETAHRHGAEAEAKHMADMLQAVLG